MDQIMYAHTIITFLHATEDMTSAFIESDSDATEHEWQMLSMSVGVYHLTQGAR